jgi:hypothetical protein
MRTVAVRSPPLSKKAKKNQFYQLLKDAGATKRRFYNEFSYFSETRPKPLSPP